MFYSRMNDGNNFLVIDSKSNQITFNGFLIPSPPNMDRKHNFSIKNGNLYANGYVWTGTKWKRNLKSIFNNFF